MLHWGTGMPKKRQNRGRHKGAKGHTKTVQCDNCGRIIPRDKAICVTRWYSPIDPQLARELEKKGAIIMRYPVEKCYCVSCAVHYGIVKVRPEEERKAPSAPQI